MRALLLALWLVWATAAAGHRTSALTHRDGGSARITSRDELAALTGAATLRLRPFEAREPQLGPAPGLPPLSVSGGVVRLALPVGPAALPLRVLEGRCSRNGLLAARSSRGPPWGELQTAV